jgi:glucokinase
MTRPREHTSLVADIGGTHVRFGIAAAGGRIGDPSTFRCADYASLTEAARAYLEEVDGPSPRRAAFAVAAPVQGDRVRMTNHVWSFSIETVRRELALERLEVLNDFAALAVALPALGDEDLTEIKAGDPAPDAPLAVLGPGTGLGVAALVPAGDSWTALTTEGGHRDLAAQTEREWRIVRHLQERFEHVSVERVLSGPGLVNLYEAVSRLAGEEPQSLTPAAIVAGAREAGLPRGDEPLLRLAGGRRQRSGAHPRRLRRRLPGRRCPAQDGRRVRHRPLSRPLSGQGQVPRVPASHPGIPHHAPARHPAGCRQSARRLTRRTPPTRTPTTREARHETEPQT